jgi:hypothetical protein
MPGKKQIERLYKAQARVLNPKTRPKAKSGKEEASRAAASKRFKDIQEIAHQYYKPGQANTMTWRDAIRKASQDYNKL